MIEEMTPDQTAAAMHGLAINVAIPPGERLRCALQALEFYVERPVLQVQVDVPEDAPRAWKDLLTGLILLIKGQVNEISPFHCEHDTLTVMAAPDSFTEDEIQVLKGLGFSPDDDGTFYSFRFGSA